MESADITMTERPDFSYEELSIAMEAAREHIRARGEDPDAIIAQAFANIQANMEAWMLMTVEEQEKYIWSVVNEWVSL
jgi:hypothetical protein